MTRRIGQRVIVTFPDADPPTELMEVIDGPVFSSRQGCMEGAGFGRSVIAGVGADRLDRGGGTGCLRLTL